MVDTPENINNEEEVKPQPESDKTSEENSETNEEIISESEEKKESEEKIVESDKTSETPESNYQISLVNENLLKIVIKTDKSVGVDCFIKDKSEEKSDPSQTNKITIHPTADGKQHEIEIVVSISPEGEVIISKPQITEAAEQPKEEEPVKKKLLIDPALSDLVEQQAQIDRTTLNIPTSWEEFYEDRLTPKNKYVVNRRIMQKNLKSGFIISLLFVFTCALIVFGSYSSKSGEQEEPPESRILTIEDLPEMKVDVPMTEKEKQALEEKENAGNNTSTPSKVNITPKRLFRTPRIIAKKDSLPVDTNISMTDEELDRIRHGGDTTKGNGLYGISGVYDSTKVYLDFSKVGWTLIDSSNVNKMQLSLFSNDSIATYIDPNIELKDFNFQIKKRGVNAEAEINKAIKNNRPFRDFIVNDSTYKGYITLGPISGAGTVEYDFMVKNDKVAILIQTYTSDALFPKYQPLIESVIRTIKLPSK